MSVTEVSWEVWGVSGGRLAMYAIDQGLPSLAKAQEAAVYAARGNMINERGYREPSREIFELEENETLADAKRGDGLYILKRVRTSL
jgi:hypothetical protein